MIRIHYHHLSHQELLENTRELVQSATSLEVKILYHLDEIRCRGLDGCLGHRSFIQFAVEGLGMTLDQAAKRSAAVTNCRRWPELMLLLEKGQISLTTINLVAPKLTNANKTILLNEILGKSTREVRQLLDEVDAQGQRRSMPALIDVKLQLPQQVMERWQEAKALVSGAKMVTLEDALIQIVDDYMNRHHPLAKAKRAAARQTKNAVASEVAINDMPESESSQMTDCRTTMSSRHGDTATPGHLCSSASLETGAVAATSDPDCRATTSNTEYSHDIDGSAPQPAILQPASPARVKPNRHIPAALQNALWLRSGGRCEAQGCGATHQLQIDHKQAFSRSGRYELSNLQLLCTSCYRLKMRREFGYDWQRREVQRRIDGIDWFFFRNGDCIPPALAKASQKFDAA